MEEEDKTIYDDEVSEEMSEGDAIDPAEEGFMRGYNEKDEGDEEDKDEEESSEEE